MIRRTICATCRPLRSLSSKYWHLASVSRV
jgi:hypothetical protein